MRHNIRDTESEKKREYHMHEKIEAGEKLVGDLGEGFDAKGGAGEVRRERERYATGRERVMRDISDEQE